MKAWLKSREFGVGLIWYALGYWVGHGISWEAIGGLWICSLSLNLIGPRVLESRWLRRRQNAKLDKELADFKAQFAANGGTCPLCCLYEYGLIHKLEKPGTREQHLCLKDVTVMRDRFNATFPRYRPFFYEPHEPKRKPN